MLFPSSTWSTDIKPYYNVTTALSHSKIEPYLEEAEYRYVKDVLGPQYADDPTDSKYDTALLDASRRVIALFAVADYMKQGNTQVSDSGVHFKSDDTTKTAFPWQISAGVLDLKERGWRAVERLLTLLWADNGSTYTDWKGSDAEKKYREYLVNSTALLQEYFQIRDSYQTLHAMLPVIRQVSEERVKPMLEKEATGSYDALLATMLSGTITADQTARLVLAQRGIANLAVVRFLKKQPSQVTALGLYNTEQHEFTGGDTRKKAATPDYESIYNACSEEGESAIKALETLTESDLSDTEKADVDPNKTDGSTYVFF